MLENQNFFSSMKKENEKIKKKKRNQIILQMILILLIQSVKMKTTFFPSSTLGPKHFHFYVSFSPWRIKSQSSEDAKKKRKKKILMWFSTQGTNTQEKKLRKW